jgi:hypothetical protein
VGLPNDPTLSQITDHPKLRAAIDAGLSLEMLAQVVEILDEDPGDVYNKVVNLSLDSWLLPPDAIDLLEDCTLLQLDAILNELGRHTDMSRLDPCSRDISTVSGQRALGPSPISLKPICGWW